MRVFDRLFGGPDIKKLKVKRDVKGMILALKNKDANIRRQAIDALEEIEDTNAIDPMTIVLLDENKDIRMRAAEVLEKMGWEPRNKTEQVFLLIAKRRWDDMVKLPIDSLIPSFEDTRLYNKVSEYYVVYYFIYPIAALWEIGQPAVSSLITTLCDRNNDIVRGFAAMALGVIGGPQSIETLTTIFMDNTEDKALRKTTAVALQCIGEPAVGPMLTALRDKNSEIGTRVSAALNLGSIGKPAVDSLIKAIRDENPEVREFAAYALAGTGDPRTIAALHSLREDEDIDIRQNTDTLLNCIGTLSSNSFLSLLQSYDDINRIVAALALGNIGNTSSVEPLFNAARFDKNDSVRNHAFFSLAKMISSIEAKEVLYESLVDKNPDVRFSAALVLLKSGVPVLREL